MQQISVNNRLLTLSNALCAQTVIHFAVLTGREALSEYVRQQMKKGERDWSTHEVARRAKAGGYTLSNGTVQNILNLRQKGEVTEATLRALAYVFGVPPAEIFGVYHGTTVVDEQVIRNHKLAALGADAEKLSPENLPKFEALMEYMQHTVRQLLMEQEREPPRKPRRGTRVIHGDGTIQEREKKRA